MRYVSHDFPIERLVRRSGEMVYLPGPPRIVRIAEAAFYEHYPQLERYFPRCWVAYHGGKCLDIASYSTELEEEWICRRRLPRNEFRIYHVSSPPKVKLDPLLSAEELVQIEPLTMGDIQRLRLQLFRPDPIERLAWLMREGVRKLW